MKVENEATCFSASPGCLTPALSGSPHIWEPCVAVRANEDFPELELAPAARQLSWAVPKGRLKTGARRTRPSDFINGLLCLGLSLITAWEEVFFFSLSLFLKGAANTCPVSSSLFSK